MNVVLFWVLFAVGVSMVLLQGIFAYCDHYFSQRQLRERGIFHGWSFLEHGGMWADVFIVSPLVAYIASTYDLHAFSWYGAVFGAFSVTVFGIGMYQWQRAGVASPEAHAHDGYTPAAGWIHGAYATVSLWVVALYFCAPITPVAPAIERIVISLILIPFFCLGAAKLSPRWTIDRFVLILLPIEIGITWAITLIRIFIA